MKRVEINGTQLAYETRGDQGSPVLLIMGLAARAQAWEWQYQGLSGRHQVARFDNRGIGESAPLRGGLSIRQMAQDAIGLMDHLRWERAHVVGVSMGGMIAQELAIASPDRLRSLSLIATHPGGRLVLPPTEGLKHFLTLHLNPVANRRLSLARLLFPPEYIEEIGREAILTRLAHNFGQAPPPSKTVAAQVLAVMNHNTYDRLERLSGTPTLIVKPERDVLIHPAQSERIHRRLPGSRLVTLEGAGHGVLGQLPDRVNHLLLEHFQEADSQRGGMSQAG